MPEYPYVYGAAGPRPVGPGGTRIRVFRRRRGREGETGGGTEAEDRWAAWREALSRAADELNRELEAGGSGVRVRLELEADALVLAIDGLPPPLPPLPALPLDPSELPRWFARLRSRLGLLVDETA